VDKLNNQMIWIKWYYLPLNSYILDCDGLDYNKFVEKHTFH
jgi:hypothetical protein